MFKNWGLRSLQGEIRFKYKFMQTLQSPKNALMCDNPKFFKKNNRARQTTCQRNSNKTKLLCVLGKMNYSVILTLYKRKIGYQKKVCQRLCRNPCEVLSL